MILLSLNFFDMLGWFVAGELTFTCFLRCFILLSSALALLCAYCGQDVDLNVVVIFEDKWSSHIHYVYLGVCVKLSWTVATCIFNLCAVLIHFEIWLWYFRSCFIYHNLILHLAEFVYEFLTLTFWTACKRAHRLLHSDIAKNATCVPWLMSCNLIFN